MLLDLRKVFQAKHVNHQTYRQAICSAKENCLNWHKMSKTPMIFIKIGNVWCKIRSCSDRSLDECAILKSSTDMKGMMYERR